MQQLSQEKQHMQMWVHSFGKVSTPLSPLFLSRLGTAAPTHSTLGSCIRHLISLNRAETECVLPQDIKCASKRTPNKEKVLFVKLPTFDLVHMNASTSIPTVSNNIGQTGTPRAETDVCLGHCSCLQNTWHLSALFWARADNRTIKERER